MAERRMFAKTIIDSDAFLDMPMSARLLYYDLSMRADDDGFINSPKKIMRTVGASDDDLKMLIVKKFIIPFETGVVVIKHWLIHNYIRKDTYKETMYKDEKAMLDVDENNAYRLPQNCNPSQLRDESVDDASTQDRIGQDRIGQDRIGKSYSVEPKLNDAILSYIEHRKKLKKPMTNKAIELMLTKLSQLSTDIDDQVEILNQSVMNGWVGIFPLKENKNQYSNQDQEGTNNFFFGMLNLKNDGMVEDDEQTGNSENNGSD